MANLNDIMSLIASHRGEVEKMLAQISARLQQQEQELISLLGEYIVTEDPTITRIQLPTITRTRDFAYLYTPLKHLQGYKELEARIRNCLLNDHIYCLGDLVHQTEAEMLRTPNFSRKSLGKLKEWLSSINESLGQNVAGWADEKNLRRYYLNEIKNGSRTGKSLSFSILRKLSSIDVYNIGQLATSPAIRTLLTDAEVYEVESWLKTYDLRLGMSQPFRPV